MHTLYEQLMKYAEQIDRYEWFTTDLAIDDEGRCRRRHPQHPRRLDRAVPGEEQVVLPPAATGRSGTRPPTR
ncbi:MAG: hypothetical protein R2691_05675 [Solirubrobacterales bacterium]